jgi:hypothetical protein
MYLGKQEDGLFESSSHAQLLSTAIPLFPQLQKIFFWAVIPVFRWVLEMLG